MNNRGMSEVVSTVIMIALVLLASVMVWTVINNLIQGKIKNSESCFGNAEKVTLDKRNICYDDSSNEVRFAISLGDVDVDEILISISNDAETKSFKIGKEDSTIEGLTYLDGTSPIKLPPKNGGKTYLYEFTDAISIKIAPIIDGTQCEISDSSSNIDSCTFLS